MALLDKLEIGGVELGCVDFICHHYPSLVKCPSCLLVKIRNIQRGSKLLQFLLLMMTVESVLSKRPVARITFDLCFSWLCFVL